MIKKLLFKTDDRIVESFKDHFVPCSDENEVGDGDFIFESCSEAAFSSFFHSFLDLSSDSWNCSDLSSNITCHFDWWVEHPSYKGGVFHYLKRLSYKFDFLQDLNSLNGTSNDLFISMMTPLPAILNFFKSLRIVCKKIAPLFCTMKLP